jgi:hypothetical protein
MNCVLSQFMVRNAVHGVPVRPQEARVAPLEQGSGYASSACGAGSFVAVARVAFARFSTSSERVCDTT